MLTSQLLWAHPSVMATDAKVMRGLHMSAEHHLGFGTTQPDNTKPCPVFIAAKLPWPSRAMSCQVPTRSPHEIGVTSVRSSCRCWRAMLHPSPMPCDSPRRSKALQPSGHHTPSPPQSKGYGSEMRQLWSSLQVQRMMPVLADSARAAEDMTDAG